MPLSGHSNARSMMARRQNPKRHAKISILFLFWGTSPAPAPYPTVAEVLQSIPRTRASGDGDGWFSFNAADLCIEGYLMCCDVVTTWKRVHLGRCMNILTADRSRRGETYELWGVRSTREITMNIPPLFCLIIPSSIVHCGLGCHGHVNQLIVAINFGHTLIMLLPWTRWYGAAVTITRHERCFFA